MIYPGDVLRIPDNRPLSINEEIPSSNLSKNQQGIVSAYQEAIVQYEISMAESQMYNLSLGENPLTTDVPVAAGVRLGTYHTDSFSEEIQMQIEGETFTVIAVMLRATKSKTANVIVQGGLRNSGGLLSAGTTGYTWYFDTGGGSTTYEDVGRGIKYNLSSTTIGWIVFSSKADRHAALRARRKVYNKEIDNIIRRLKAQGKPDGMSTDKWNRRLEALEKRKR